MEDKERMAKTVAVRMMRDRMVRDNVVKVGRWIEGIRVKKGW